VIRIAAVVFLACGETAAIMVSAALYTPERGTLPSDLLVVVTAVGLLGGFFAVIAVALRTSTHPGLIAHDIEVAPAPPRVLEPEKTRLLPVKPENLLLIILSFLLSLMLVMISPATRPR